jgi:hypothetical protein
MQPAADPSDSLFFLVFWVTPTHNNTYPWAGAGPLGIQWYSLNTNYFSKKTGYI